MNTNKKLKILILLITIAIIYLDLFTVVKTQPLIEENGSLDIFFCKYHDCEQELIKITTNSETLLCAFYDLTNKELIQHLKKENAKIITHKQEEFEQIKTKGLMHHKFCVINQTHITTGSYNPTTNNEHHENLIIIESKTLAKNYEEEFTQLKELNNKEIQTKKETDTNQIIFNEHELENYFCPQDKCKEQIIRIINSANQTIKFILFTFTDTDIAAALINKKEEGLKVKGIIENFQNKKYWVTPLLQENNITIKIHSSNIFQHNKIIITENKVITGSYNPTRAANTINDENILIITQPEIVKKYHDYFSDFFKSLE